MRINAKVTKGTDKIMEQKLTDQIIANDMLVLEVRR